MSTFNFTYNFITSNCIVFYTPSLQSITTKSFPTSQESGEGRNESFNRYFAQTCLNNINKCSTIEEELEFRYRILHKLFYQEQLLAKS